MPSSPENCCKSWAISCELNLDSDHSAECLSEQYSAVFSQPRPEWDIPSMEEFFKIVNSMPTGPILTDIEFSESDIEYAYSELSGSSSPGPDGVPATLLKVCKKELSAPLYILWRASMTMVLYPQTCCWS